MAQEMQNAQINPCLSMVGTLSCWCMMNAWKKHMTIIHLALLYKSIYNLQLIKVITTEYKANFNSLKGKKEEMGQGQEDVVDKATWRGEICGGNPWIREKPKGKEEEWGNRL